MGNAAAPEAAAKMDASTVVQATAKRSRHARRGQTLTVLTVMTWITSLHLTGIWIDVTSLTSGVHARLAGPKHLSTHVWAPAGMRPPCLEPDVTNGTDPPVQLEGTNQDNCEC